MNLEKRTSVRVVLRLAGGDAVGRGALVRIEHLPPRRSFWVFVNLLIGSLGLVDFYTELWQLPVGSLVTWLGESVSIFWERLPVPPQLLLLTPPTQVARRVDQLLGSRSLLLTQPTKRLVKAKLLNEKQGQHKRDRKISLVSRLVRMI